VCAEPRTLDTWPALAHTALTFQVPESTSSDEVTTLAGDLSAATLARMAACVAAGVSSPRRVGASSCSSSSSAACCCCGCELTAARVRVRSSRQRCGVPCANVAGLLVTGLWWLLVAAPAAGGEQHMCCWSSAIPRGVQNCCPPVTEWVE
jgi:hypothetical protein